MLRGVLGKTFRLLGYTIQYGCIAHCTFEYIGGVVMCSGPSMEPTIQNSDIVFAENLSRHFYGIQSDFFKSHSYVPRGHVWLEGDNLQNSTDSRYYGPIPYGLIRGRIFFKVWPLSDCGFLRSSPNGHRFSDD
uniref:Inner mitochondrial membrane peptidase subunit 1 n=1 Tax=Cavia porcellus TaxID=10141 RepID=H0W4V0_CAVPO